MDKKIIDILLTSLFMAFIIPIAYIFIEYKLSSVNEKEWSVFEIIDKSVYLMVHFYILLVIAIVSLLLLIFGKMKFQIIPLVALIATFITIKILDRKLKEEYSTVVFEAMFKEERVLIHLYLRHNKTYKIEDNHLFGGATYHGKFSVEGDSILLDEKYPMGKDNDFFSNKLLIRDSFLLIKPDSSGIYQDNDPFKMKILGKGDLSVY